MSKTIAWIVEGGRENPASRLRAYDIADALLTEMGVAGIFPPFTLTAPPTTLVLQKVCSNRALELAQRLKSTGTRCVYDLCDPIWMQEDINSQRDWHMERAVSLVDIVVVPTVTLQKAVIKRYPNVNCRVIPDALPLNHSKFNRRPPHLPVKRLRIAWFSTTLNLQHLTLIADGLRRFAKDHDILLRIISAPHQEMLPALPHIPLEFIPWQLANYQDRVKECDIALLATPLDDWNSGKSSNRLQLCLALGVPAVFTPLPAYLDLLAGQPKLLALSATEPDTWHTALLSLRDAAIREELAVMGRQLVEDKAHLSQTLPLWRSALFGDI